MAPKSAQPFPSPKVNWSTVNEDIYAVFAVALEKNRVDIFALSVVKARE